MDETERIELHKMNRQRIRQFLIDRHSEGYQQVEIGRDIPDKDRGYPWMHGVEKIVTCFHPDPKKEIRCFGIPIKKYGFLRYEAGEAICIEFTDSKAYEDHKKKWEIRTKQRRNLDTYLFRKKNNLESSENIR